MPVCNIQVKFNPFVPQKELLEFCKKEEITLTAYSPLGRGKVMVDRTLIEIGKQYNKTAAQVSLKWLLQKGAVIIPKSSSEEHLRADMDLSNWELSADDMNLIDNLSVKEKVAT